MPTTETLNAAEHKQYHRHLVLTEIGLEGQLKLKKAKVLVVGAGGLGCPILQYLTAAGIGTLGIIDGDHVEQTNLQRQILYTRDDLGQSKAKTAAKRLERLNPEVKFEVYEAFLTPKNAIALFQQYDIIVDGSDNFPTRYLVNDACILTQKPFVFGAIFKFQGQVSVFNHNGSGSYRCLYPVPPTPDSAPNCSDVGVLGVLPGIIGTFQANETIKMITGIGSLLVNTLLYFDALSMKQQLLKFKKKTTIKITTLMPDYRKFCGIRTLADSASISAQAAKKTRDHYTVLDVRTLQEYELENIGGLHIPLDELDSRILEIPLDKPILVCCASGVRSAQAIARLSKILTTTTFVNLAGGLAEYVSIDDG